MELIELRKKFVELSGRYDLVVDPDKWADAGANFFINSGIRFLDRRADIVASREAVSVIPVRAKDPEFTVENCWHIHSVEMLPAASSKAYTDRWIVLMPMRQSSLRISARALGMPCGYARVPGRHSPSFINVSCTQLKIAEADLLPQSSELYDSPVLQLYPIPATNILIKVSGFFYSDILIEDTDTNFWLSAHPEIALKAALYQLEVFYRNTEGASDWLQAIQIELTDIEQQEIQHFTAGRNQMED